MKILVFFFSILFFFSYDVTASQKFYIQGSLNQIFVDNPDIDRYNGSTSGLTFTGLDGTLEFDNDTGLGFEIGLKSISESNFRLGYQYSKFDLKFDKGSGAGTITDGSNTVNFSVSATKSQLEAIGIDFDNDVSLHMVNGYYDFNGYWETFVPFVGVGLGIASIENAQDDESAYSFILGFKKYISENNIYIGYQSSFITIDGPEDKLELEYDDINVHIASIQVGFEF